MARSDSNRLVAGLLVIAIVIAVAGLVLNLALVKSLQGTGVPFFTGFATQDGNTSFTQAGAAGLLITNSTINFGSGYYNSTCGDESPPLDYSILDSSASVINPNTAPTCWINTSGWSEVPQNHSLENNGSVALNVTAQSNLNAKDFMCGIAGTCNGTFTNVTIQSVEDESTSCTGLTSGFEFFTNASLNSTVGICDSLKFQQGSDTIHVQFYLTISNDIPAGSKSMIITYEGTAL